jgi:hypothetical protein
MAGNIVVPLFSITYTTAGRTGGGTGRRCTRFSRASPLVKRLLLPLLALRETFGDERDTEGEEKPASLREASFSSLSVTSERNLW